MKILITGSQGMLGQEFLRQLNMITWEHDNMGTVEVIGWDRPQLDITDQQAVLEKINQLKPTIIINCAAYNAVDKIEADPAPANLINGAAVGYLAQAAAGCGATFVHFSSDYVFDGEKGSGYVESDIPNPVSQYGQSKLLGEQKLINLSAYKLTNWYLVRTSKLFGPPGISAGSKKSFPEMMLGFARDKGKIEAIDAEVASPTYVKDLAQTVINMLQNKQPSGIYHITNSGSCTWYEYAKTAIECAGVQAEVVPVGPNRFPRPAKRPLNSTLLNTKLPPLRSWQEALKEFLQMDK